MSEVIVVTSGKGGVGKTTTTANIGTGLAKLGKKVVMIDTDTGLRNLDVVLGLENRIVYNLVDVVEGNCRLKQAMIADKRCPKLFLLPTAQTRDKSEVTPEQMTYDNLNTGAYFTQMVKGVFIVGKSADGVGLGGRYQITEMLTGDIFASYIANINTYSYTTYHNDHYALYRDWYNAPFNDAYTNVMQPWKSIVEKTDESSPARAMATTVPVLPSATAAI